MSLTIVLYPSKTDKVLLVKDNDFVNAIESDPILFKIDNLLEKHGLKEEVFRYEGDDNNDVTLVSNNISQVMSGAKQIIEPIG